MIGVWVSSKSQVHQENNFADQKLILEKALIIHKLLIRKIVF